MPCTSCCCLDATAEPTTLRLCSPVSPQGGHTAGGSPREGGSPRGGFGLAPSAMAFVPHKWVICGL